LRPTLEGRSTSMRCGLYGLSATTLPFFQKYSDCDSYHFDLSRRRIASMFRAAYFVLALGLATTSYGAEPVLDNERLTVWDTTSSLPPAQHDFVAVSLSHSGTAIFGHKGEVAGKAGGRTVVIELKDHPFPPIANTSGYPLAFPRPNAKKLLENNKV